MIRRPTEVDDPAKRVALDCLAAGIEAADPETVIEERLSLDGTALTVNGDVQDLSRYEDVIVVGGGNAAGRAASALEGVLGTHIDRGAVVTDAPAETDTIDVLPGDHPVPSERGVESARTVLDIARSADADDLVVALITGGGSALLPVPAEGVDLDSLQRLTEALLESGATIGEINAVRKHCSSLKGGQLAAAAAPATVVGLVFSDVVGNRLDVIASGPVTPDDTTFEDATEVLDRYDVAVPDSVGTRLADGVDGTCPETPGPNDTPFEAVTNHVIADSYTALDAAADAASESGYDPLVLSSRVRGEAREAARALVGIGEECADTGTPLEPPAAILTGGETTVTITGDGEGGPNQEFVLSAALDLEVDDVVVAAVDTDGIDGNADAAGAVAGRLSDEAKSAARAALAANDAAGFFRDRDGAVVTGPTGTNVNDLRVFVME